MTHWGGVGGADSDIEIINIHYTKTKHFVRLHKNYQYPKINYSQ